MRQDAFDAVVEVLSKQTPLEGAEEFITRLAEAGFTITPRRKSKPKRKRSPRLRVIEGGMPPLAYWGA